MSKKNPPILSFLFGDDGELLDEFIYSKEKTLKKQRTKSGSDQRIKDAKHKREQRASRRLIERKKGGWK